MLNKKNNLIKLGELSLAGTALASLSINSNVQKSVKASGNVPKVSSDTDARTLNTNALTRMMNKNTERNVAQLAANKVSAVTNASNGGFDSSWGKLDVKDWKGHVDGNYYVLDQYTGDPYHVIVPNAADFKAAGIDTQGKQVGVDHNFMHKIYMKLYQNKDKDGSSIAFSKTDGEKVKANDPDWTGTFNPNRHGNDFHYNLTKFDGSSLDVSDVSSMDAMFANNKLSDLSSFKDWDVHNVQYMQEMFEDNDISDLTPLTNWKTDSVTDTSAMFSYNHISDLAPLTNWKVDNVTDMNAMFNSNQIKDLAPLTNWKVNNVTDMNSMFADNKIKDLSPLRNWHIDKVTDVDAMFYDNNISDLSPISNWNMSNVKSSRSMFYNNNISDLSPISNWNMSNVKDMGLMFYNNNLSDLTPLKNWNISNASTVTGMFERNAVTKADFSKWNFSNIKTINPLDGGTGLNTFIDEGNQHAIINLGDNSSFPDWFMNPTVNGRKNNNIFTANYGGNLILTSNSKLLANPNKDFNHISTSIFINNKRQLGETPVFINSTWSNVLQDANKAQQTTLNNLKNKYSNYVFDDNPEYDIIYDTLGQSNTSKYDANNPISVVNALYNAQHQYTFTVKFNDTTSSSILNSNTVALNGLEKDGTIDYTKVNNAIKQLQDSGYNVSNINANKPNTIVSTWENVGKLHNTSSNAYNVTNNKGQAVLTYNVSHKMVKVTHDAPKTTSDIITGTTNKFPAGVGQDDLNKTITRTITLKDENGNPMGKDIVQTIHMHRDATVDAVTGAITYTHWVADGSFDSVDVPKIDGYTPDKSTIAKIDKPEIGKDYNTSVVYTRNNEDASITYIDDTTGQVLKSESTKPKFGDVIKFETTPSDYIKELESKGYELVSNDYKDGVTASQDTTNNKFTVHVKHRLSKVERNKDVHEHINYNVTDANGKSSNESSGSNPVLHFKQTGVKDEVTGKTDWDGSLNSQTFSSVNTVKHQGYVADITTIPAKTVTITNGNWNKSHDINTTVNYTPAEETVKMVVKDENGNIIQTIVKHGKFGEDYDFTNDKPKIDGYTFEKASDNIKGKFNVNNKDIVLTYKKNEVKKPEKPVIPTKPSKPQRTPEDTSIFGKNIKAQKDDQGLPEMAENKSGLVAAGVGIASLVGLTGLAGVQLKKRRS